MDINGVISIAQRIHDAEGVDLGRSSTREQRNEFWARVIGCVYHGHPVYNPNPDKQWHLKNGGGGRPQSDDVTVSMPSRAYWDCIPNAGANGYYFEAGSGGTLPANQEVYAPPVPSGGGSTKPQPPTVKPCPDPSAHLPKSKPEYPGDAQGIDIGAILFADYAEAKEAPNAGMGVWFFRCAWVMANEAHSPAQAIARYRPEWRKALGLR